MLRASQKVSGWAFLITFFYQEEHEEHKETGCPVKIKNLHDWDVSYREAVKIQTDLKEKLILHDEDIPSEIHFIAGADISYSRGSDLFFAAVILLQFPTMEIIEKTSFSQRVNFPYIPGLLTFREGPALLKAFEKLNHRPDVVIFDGHGIAHPRGIGLASHMGLFLDMPTVGCAKKRLAGIYDEPGNEAGNYSYLTLDGRSIGAVVRTKKKVKPIFVSQGHKISLQTAIDVALSTCAGYRLAEPVRMAHLEVNRIRLNHRFS
ncbi:MAG: deoxyribonuclease V [Syntrophobacterales bacterium]|nr:deoxyribonuclease V [Syntrophobacterales bacterium]